MVAGNRFPTVEETLSHPAYPGVTWNLEPHQKGLLPCANDRGGPVNIYWEIHGNGPRKLILIMGLAGLSSSWQRQTKHFGHDRGDTYSVLLIDNRGVGQSSAPIQRYSTSHMARDALEVIDHVGWSAPRSLHLVGISLGGMISQELACLIPDRLASLTLLCTTAGMDTSSSPLATLRDRIGMFIPKSVGRAVEDTALKLFTDEWLHAPDEAAELPVPGVTPRCGPPVVPEGDAGAGAGAAGPGQGQGQAQGQGGGEYLRFDSNFQRFQAQELNKRLDARRYTRTGFLMQLAAAAWHHKSPEQLKELGDKVGRHRIAVVHGDADVMIDVQHGRKLIESLQPGVGLVVEGMGHAPVMQNVAWLHEFLEERVTACEEAPKNPVT
ncbi:glycylpeptide N-tetradecanoyltransferase [Sodiomyces alkalinus F11]|uniref:Glycylpeptide N-tetradecanoyltransferase n=1 Tax=Sodiomyces alkalinus (strain CBS 110278 / VKM F-3762 / F11) TaxID=1314773 RepID=A0A3N2PKG0_SODAK|nr:glycylpeptide N-tetradecanoyltransferase [Sodiomyces alkalinus F11]ROT35032.1 glycylpeptide N-tetradecanoyltransferase [Sodiomyces alkalinus F11]